MLLSIIIPAREEEKIIAQALTQFKGTLSSPYETIVSDASSKDRTVDIAREYADRVIVFTGEKHTAGIGRNDGAKVARGDYFVFIDADTEIPDPQVFFERAIQLFKNDPDVVGVTGPQRVRPDTETWADRFSLGALNALIRFLNNVARRGEAVGKFMIVSRAAFENVHGFREDLVTREDGDFFYRLSKIGRTVYDPSLLTYHSGRRAHKVGWAHLWYIWTVNTLSVLVFNKAVADDWTPIR